MNLNFLKKKDEMIVGSFFFSLCTNFVCDFVKDYKFWVTLLVLFEEFCIVLCFREDEI